MLFVYNDDGNLYSGHVHGGMRTLASTLDDDGECNYIWNRPGLAIQADGDELEAIDRQFRNIPMPTKAGVVTWRGEMARFIIDHLVL